MPRTATDSLIDILNGLSGELLVEKPCEIVKVNSQYSVDIKYYDNNEPDYLYNVPVKHLQTQSAFIFLGLKEGDCGTVRFFDNDVTGYYQASEYVSNEERRHDINDNLFSLGFYPSSKQYLFPDGDIVIGTTSGAVINLTDTGISITGGDITITGIGNVSISGASVTLGSDTTIDGKKFLEHTHSNGNEGSPTGGVI